MQLVSKISNLCGSDPPTLQTDGQTDRRTTCDRNTVLCTKVHRAVKTESGIKVKFVRKVVCVLQVEQLVIWIYCSDSSSENSVLTGSYSHEVKLITVY